MDIFKKMGRNWAKNTKPKALGSNFKKAAWTLGGGTIYWLIPTALQGWFKTDMSGLKGVLVGASGAAVIGMLSDKKEILGGGLATAGIHLTYNHLNDSITNIFSSPIFGYQNGSVSRTYDDMGLPPKPADDDASLPKGYAYNENGELVALNLPDNSKMLAPRDESMNDFTNELNPKRYEQEYGRHEPVGDFVSAPGAFEIGSSFDPGNVPL